MKYFICNPKLNPILIITNYVNLMKRLVLVMKGFRILLFFRIYANKLYIHPFIKQNK